MPRFARHEQIALAAALAALLAASAVRLAARPAAPRAGADSPAVAPLDLNEAGVEDLEALPGVGPVLARRIVARRAAHGPFRSPDDLLSVPGIGPALLARLRPLVAAP